MHTNNNDVDSDRYYKYQEAQGPLQSPEHNDH